MTIETLTPAPLYVVDGTGPYAVPHPYGSAAELIVVAIEDEDAYPLEAGADYTADPAVAEVDGAITLSSGAATAHAGRTLSIGRATLIEQGWAGVAGPRERGLERALDRLTMALQDYKAGFDQPATGLYLRRTSNLSDLVSTAAARETLEVARRQSGTMDSEEGRGLMVGAGGLLGNAGALTADPATLTKTAWWRFTADQCAGFGFPFEADGLLTHVAWSNDGARQVLEPLGTGEQWTRDRVAGTWGSWRLMTSFRPHLQAITVGVGTTGDYPDLPAADAALWRHVANGTRVNLQIVSPLTTGWGVRDRDCSNYYIRSDIGTVTLDAGFEGFDATTYGYGPVDTTGHLIVGLNAGLPTLACIIDMDNEHGHGYSCTFGGHGFVVNGAGVINAGGHGLECRAGRINAHMGQFNGANQAAVRCAFGGEVNVQQANLFGACQDPETGSQGAIDCSRSSKVHARLADLSGSGASAINCRRNSAVNFEEADCSGAAFSNVLFYQASYGSGYDADLSDATGAAGGSGFGRGLTVETGSTVHVGGATIRNNVTRDIEVNNGGTVIAPAVRTTGSPVGGPPTLANTNVPAFNAVTFRGVIYAGNV